MYVSLGATDAEGVAKGGDAALHRMRSGETALGMELYGAMVINTAMGESYIREQLSVKGRGRCASEQERGRERDEARSRTKRGSEANECDRQAGDHWRDILASADQHRVHQQWAPRKREHEHSASELAGVEQSRRDPGQAVASRESGEEQVRQRRGRGVRERGVRDGAHDDEHSDGPAVRAAV